MTILPGVKPFLQTVKRDSFCYENNLSKKLKDIKVIHKTDEDWKVNPKSNDDKKAKLLYFKGPPVLRPLRAKAGYYIRGLAKWSNISRSSANAMHYQMKTETHRRPYYQHKVWIWAALQAPMVFRVGMAQNDQRYLCDLN